MMNTRPDEIDGLHVGQLEQTLSQTRTRAFCLSLTCEW